MMTKVKQKYDAIDMSTMNTKITVYCIHHNQDSFPWKKHIYKWFEHVQKVCSRFSSRSSLTVFNNSKTDCPIMIPVTLYSVIEEAWDYAQKTDFLFHPFIAESLERLGYNKSFDKMKNKVETFVEKSPTKVSTLAPVQRKDSGYWNQELLIFYPHMKSIEKRTADKLDLGGIAKGWSVDRATEILKNKYRIASGFVNAGGDINIWSEKSDYWRIGVAHPYDKHKEIAQLHISNGGIATSNKLYRRWIQGDNQHHHIIHGHTLLPAESDVIQATVIAPSTTEAEIIAKVLCMLNIKDGIAWITNKFPHIAYILIDENLEITISSNMYKYVSNLMIRQGESKWKSYSNGYPSGS